MSRAPWEHSWVINGKLSNAASWSQDGPDTWQPHLLLPLTSLLEASFHSAPHCKLLLFKVYGERCPDHILEYACAVTGAAVSGSSVPDTDARSGGHAGFLPFLLGPARVQRELCLQNF